MTRICFKGEASAPLPSFKNTQDKSIYSLPVSLSLSLSVPRSLSLSLLEGNIVE
jgi:hypothetical protein